MKLFDLAAFADRSVRIRFRMATDSSIPSTGWWIDDVLVEAALFPAIVNDALVDAGGAAHARAVTETLVVPEPGFAAMLAAGVAAVAALGRRRLRRA